MKMDQKKRLAEAEKLLDKALEIVNEIKDEEEDLEGKKHEANVDYLEQMVEHLEEVQGSFGNLE
jgi:hypothetical protein